MDGVIISEVSQYRNLSCEIALATETSQRKDRITSCLLVSPNRERGTRTYAGKESARVACDWIAYQVSLSLSRLLTDLLSILKDKDASLLRESAILALIEIKVVAQAAAGFFAKVKQKLSLNYDLKCNDFLPVIDRILPEVETRNLNLSDKDTRIISEAIEWLNGVATQTCAETGSLITRGKVQEIVFSR